MNKQALLKEIISLKEEGLGSRKIAKKLGIGKTTVNQRYKEYLEGNTTEIKKPKILLLDLESTPSVVVAFGRFKQNIGQEAVLREGGWLLSYAYKWLGEDKVKGNVLTPGEAIDANDSGLCMELWELVEQADVIIYHNGLNFDLPLLKARMLINGLPPIRKVKSIDTLQMVKEFKLNSNKLNSLGKQLDIGAKLDHEGMGLWIKCMEGNQEALNHMLEYNKVDIQLLEEVYTTIAPYSTRHVNLSAYYGDKPRCNICCSDDVSKTGNTVSTNLSMFEEVVCNECGARFKTRQSITTSEQRKNFLSN